MAFYDLHIKWSSDKSPVTHTRRQNIQQLLQFSQYSFLGVNTSNYSKQLQPPPDVPALKRLTIHRDFTSNLQNTEILALYDLVVVRPKTDHQFLYCCIEGDCDIISLPVHQRLNLKIKLNLVQEAMKRGVMFQICYAPSLRDINKRRVFVNNAANLIRSTRGKNIIISSGARDLMEQRAPWDVINMGCVLGMTTDKAKESITSNPIKALKHAQSRKIFKAAVEVLTREEFENSDF